MHKGLNLVVNQKAKLIKQEHIKNEGQKHSIQFGNKKGEQTEAQVQGRTK